MNFLSMILLTFVTEKSAEKAGSGAGCDNEFRFPPGCDGDACDYIAKWIRRNADEVEFEVKNKVNDDMWTAIGFSEDQFMVGWGATNLKKKLIWLLITDQTGGRQQLFLAGFG